MTSVYMDIEQIKKVEKEKVTVGDIASVLCMDEKLKYRICNVQIYNFAEKKENRVIISALKIVESILSEVKEADISLLGESAILIEYQKKKKKNIFPELAKISIICLIAFFGAALTIMAFNNEAGVETVFNQYYMLITGREKEKFTILEASYSAGIGIGIIVFYNHIGKKKITKDPTPIEVEMRLYENNINKTLINGVKRENEHIDVN